MTDKEKISELKKLVEVLCDNVSDSPSGCDACWLNNADTDVCDKELLFERMKENADNPM